MVLPGEDREESMPWAAVPINKDGESKDEKKQDKQPEDEEEPKEENTEQD